MSESFSSYPQQNTWISTHKLSKHPRPQIAAHRCSSFIVTPPGTVTPGINGISPQDAPPLAAHLLVKLGTFQRIYNTLRSTVGSQINPTAKCLHTHNSCYRFAIPSKMLDTKNGGSAGCVMKAKTLQKNLDRLGRKVKYSGAKCGNVDFSSWNKSVEHFLNGERIQKSKFQRILGVLVQHSQQVHLQVDSAVKKANSSISRHPAYKKTRKCLSAYQRKGVLALETVQRMFTSKIPGMSG